MLLISQVAALAKEIEKDSVARNMLCPVTHGECPRGIVFDEDFTPMAFGSNEESPCGATTHTETGIDTNRRNSLVSGKPKPIHIDTSKRCPLTGGLHSSEKLKLMQLLDQWEEPDRNFDSNHVRSPCL
jgi:hypothetical protein